MALPTIDLTWRANINQTIAASGTLLTTNRRAVRAIKDSLISSAGYNVAPASLWTVRGSSDGSTAGLDGTDRWTSDGALVWANAGAAPDARAAAAIAVPAANRAHRGPRPRAAAGTCAR